MHMQVIAFARNFVNSEHRSDCVNLAFSLQKKKWIDTQKALRKELRTVHVAILSSSVHVSIRPVQGYQTYGRGCLQSLASLSLSHLCICRTKGRNLSSGAPVQGPPEGQIHLLNYISGYVRGFGDLRPRNWLFWEKEIHKLVPWWARCVLRNTMSESGPFTRECCPCKSTGFAGSGNAPIRRYWPINSDILQTLVLLPGSTRVKAPIWAYMSNLEVVLSCLRPPKLLGGWGGAGRSPTTQKQQEAKAKKQVSKNKEQLWGRTCLHFQK